ncbi:hypothetical protein [Streptomyces sp. NPDC056105]|uniref:hypothetical protein n=1 Tax=Streptomyces sp. NPDC056105 TaxID=3345714 RepID=UPI0035E2A12A
MSPVPGGGQPTIVSIAGRSSAERGRRAADRLVERLYGTAPIPHGTTATAPPRLVVRASTAPPTENTRST